MKKLLYISLTDISNKNDGVWKKISNQLDEFENYFNTYFIGYSKSDITFCNNGNEKILKNLSKKHRRYRLLEEAIKLVKYGDFSYVYIRFMYCDGAFIKLLKAIKKCNCKIIIEIPTYPYKQESKTNYKLRISYYLDCIYRHLLKKYVSKIATFSTDKEIFSIPCLNIMNGINVDSIKIKHCINSSQLNLLAVASIAKWHGYDRLIEGINDYYRNGGTKMVVFHLVGEGDEIPKYKKFVEEYHLQNNVLFHGFKSGSELDDMYDKCDIAIASLGMHRMNIYLASTLKTREYAAKGAPMVTSCAIDAFPVNECNYVLKFPEDESNIDVTKIIDFYDNLIKKYGTAEKLAQTIRSDAKERCDMSIVMKPIIEYFIGN
ncbi:MAG: glycosyltransferase [Clostridiales bacterium]